MASTKKLVINAEKPSSKSTLKKTSLEDLAENGFTIGRMCAKGTYSKVKIARFQDMEIAVKIIKIDKLSMQFRNKFLPRELDILTKVEHPNIVHVCKIFIYPKRIYIFMELIQKDLLQVIRENEGRLMEFQAHHYFKQMISGLLYLHSLNISHRDLKCENIMINDNEEVKIIDFGFSRSTVTKEGRRMLSHTFCGSVTYAAPEVLQGFPYNPMMYDVWCLGCILFIMVTGEIPFDDSNVLKMVMCQLNRQIQYPESVSVTEQVKTLISRMLEPDVIRRATLKQLSKSKWLKQETNFLPKHPSLGEYNIQGTNPTNSISRGTQTCIECEYYDRLRSWHECKCSTSSDDSD